MSSRQLRRLGKDDLETTLLKLTSKASSSSPALENEDESLAQPTVTSSNMFMLMDDDDEEEEEEEEEEEAAVSPVEEESPIIKLETKSQKRNTKKTSKKKNKKTKNQSKKGPSLKDEDGEDDEEFARLLTQFQKKNITSYKSLDSQEEYDEYDDDDGFMTADEEVSQGYEDNLSTWKQYNLRDDPGFTKFKHFKPLNALFNKFDFKQLIPDNEFKLLFDDLSPETLQDIDSVTSTHVSPEVLKQIERLKRLVKNWSGKDKRSVPNGGSVRKLQFTKIRDDWLPTVRGEFILKKLSNDDLTKWSRWQRPLDWDAVIKDDVERKWSKHFTYYKFDALNDTNSKKALTEFYLSTVLHPDHEALISIISSQFPYHVPGLLQVALICVRQGDKSNSNGLVERALFVFDRCLKNGIEFTAKDFQLPYIYFYNRQFYLAIMRYIQIVSQRGAVSTAAQWCKTLLSLSPLEDPLGARYFMDHYLAANDEYQYIIQMIKNPLFNLYKQWFTLGLGMTAVYSYWKLSCIEEAKQLLKRVWNQYPSSLYRIYEEVLLGDPSKLKIKLKPPTVSASIETKAYTTRMGAIWKEAEAKKFLLDELASIFNSTSFDTDAVKDINDGDDDDDVAPTSFFINNIPINLLRFAILSQESSVMAAIPEEIWSDHSVFEFDVLPPQPHDRESEYVVETIEGLIDSKHLEISQMNRFADEELLQHINQLSIQEYLEQQQQQQQPNEEIE
ncbi:Rqc1p [Kluyveromyces lactis]|uniref:KLLA0F14817p n=1 Tax=Kluyveromyces lactis (strain ATCC 8585 / CBS 2359 / DSM 70799 / NBRC 1267 / NRRL Y-1140 / WM37) TaxID=284590 RepID=Q6CJZ3_KLULA|nr:uncharacterized protein KLLA0_F14817g [Kluyveromyces lactis]CAG98454.1 KLLA0F14817p [Kluyveromyces lactis]|eukprot:XP_455746.1 uncharacterized protein KLLA0_F14817g [Kluyveromyces lactis]